jgi:hypothetical protein
MVFITLAAIYIKMVIPAEAGIHDCTGFRVKPGMTTINMFTCRSNNTPLIEINAY